MPGLKIASLFRTGNSGLGSKTYNCLQADNRDRDVSAYHCYNGNKSWTLGKVKKNVYVKVIMWIRKMRCVTEQWPK